MVKVLIFQLTNSQVLQHPSTFFNFTTFSTTLHTTTNTSLIIIFHFSKMEQIDETFFQQHNTVKDIRDICSLPSIQIAANRVENPQSDQYEYHSVSLGGSILCKAFHQDHWLITPESHDGDYSMRRPDLVVECIRFQKIDPSGFLRFPTLQEYEKETEQDTIAIGLHLI